ncbi:MAG: pyrroline-5-carboxylate reductase [Bacteroides graminisolvens]|nr:pyrroline-5-carboxylate reductase [Bacteroides graminisolvens]MBP6980310.1 pyrroline-5-carboxylate reductase [Bacteroides sp.]MCD8495468.1 pyrroline-5-carboxylate reductase [Bacteroides graminisolvens]MCD8572962.1 pyrroline-5-carboxylate reductase [Bacteroides graminisolvens]MEA4886238.1 pyrroline-5-carboxylate reductase [Bacteroides graminisolvens]
MKVAIIGAGNMGGAIARGMAQGSLIRPADITVSNPSEGKLRAIKEFNPQIKTTCNNQEAINEADLIILAVKPWFIKEVIEGLTLQTEKQIIASVAAGIPFAEYEQWIGEKATIFRIIPNTAISQMQSMTLLASHNASKEQEALLANIFNEMGVAMLIDEKQMGAATALTSCGIAYVLKYIQAAMQAGVEMGIYPKDAARMVAQSVKGAAELILTNESHPSVEIDKVTTPGGLTIKGINELEHGGFTSAIINAMKASLK